MFHKFTISGSSLKLLKVGEQGVIAKVSSPNPMITHRLKKWGLAPGTSITLEQQFPQFVVRTLQGSLALTQAMIEAIYVRT